MSNCAKLTEITLPQGITKIGDVAFWGCVELTEITLPQGITEIGDYAFESCTKLTHINLPNSITQIGDQPFSSCFNLTYIIIDSDNEAEIERIKFLLPSDLFHKVVSKTPYVWAQQEKNAALTRIKSLAKISPLYPSVKHGSLDLCGDVLTVISGFQGEDNQYYNSAKQEMDAIAMPKNPKNPENKEQMQAYQDSLNNIVERHLKQAEDDERKQIEEQYLKSRRLFSFDKDNSQETYQKAFKKFAQQYSALNEEDLKHHILSFDKFHRCCDELTQKYSDFERRDEKAAIDETGKLLNTLQQAFINYVKAFKQASKPGNKTANNKDALCDNLQMFKQECQEAIDDARSGLEKHRGLKKILTNLAIAVLTLGVGLLIGGTINYALTGRFFFHPPTRTEKILNKTDRAIGDADIPKPR